MCSGCDRTEYELSIIIDGKLYCDDCYREEE